MKKFIGNAWLRITTFLFLSFYSLIGFAQDKGVDVDISVKKDNWYSQPWIWIVGGAVFILLLVALLRGGSRREA